MTTVIAVPPSLDDETFEQVIEQLAPLSPEQKILVDARHTRWASPYGLTALLALAQTRSERAGFAGPEAEDTASYWQRAGFYRHAEEVFEMHGHVPRPRNGTAESNVLLEITPISKSDDVHEVVEGIQARAQTILVHELNLDPQATMRFAMTLSEVCQNIVEHAGRGGWVAVQTYHYRKRLGRRVVVIAVCDAGIGFRRSLESAPNRRLSGSVGRRHGAGRCADPRGEPVSRSGTRTGSGGRAPLCRQVGRETFDPKRNGAHRDRAELG